MSKLTIDINPHFVLEVESRESDSFSKLVYIKFRKHYVSETVIGTDELFLTPDQTELMARFLLRKAEEIRTEQKFR